MSIAKTQRVKKRQLGQFLTPPAMARQLVEGLPFTKQDRVLEPSMGDGSFILPLIEKFLELYLTVRSFSGRNRKLKNPRFCLENKAFVNMPPEAAWYAT